MLEIKDSVAVITGGASGIGLSCAQYWALQGGKVVIADVPIGRLVEPEEVASLACELYRNEALAGDVFFIHGGLRLGSRG